MIKTIEINGQQYAAGLFWQLVERNGKQRVHAKELRSEADANETLNAMVELSNPPQVGVGQFNHHGQKKKSIPKTPSLACAILQVLDNKNSDGKSAPPVSALVRIKLPGENYWCMAISSGVILPNGDFIGSKEEVDSVFRENFQLDQANDEPWEALFLDAQDDEDGFREIESILEEVRPKAVPHIQAISKPPYKALGFVALAILILLSFWGLIKYQKWQKDEELRVLAEKARVMARNNKLAEAEAKKQNWKPPRPEELFPPVWENQPSVQDVLRHCYAEISKFPPTRMGWNLDMVKCSSSSLNLRWKITLMGDYTNPPTGAQISPDKEKPYYAFQNVRFTLSPRGKSQLRDIAETQARLHQTHKQLRAEIKTDLDAQATKTVESPDGPVIIRAPYRHGGVTFAQIKYMNAFLNHFDMGGVVINAVIYNAQKHLWQIGGDYYASLK